MSTGEQQLRDDSPFAERRQAPDGDTYTALEFQQFFGPPWLTFWNAATTVQVAEPNDAVLEAQPPVLEGSVPQSASAVGVCGASQPAAVTGYPGVRLHPDDVIGIRQREAALGPPRSRHRMARNALNQIFQNSTYDSHSLDDVFDWVPYVAAHALSREIIGPGITHAMAQFVGETNDHNRVGAPRLDFFFYRTDGTVRRVHPGRTAKDDARLIFQ